MFRTIPIILALAMLPIAVPADAQGRGRTRREVARAQGVPPGQLPPPGMCRVWYDGVPAGKQPRATSCREAELIAARDRSGRARVIYGDAASGRYGSGEYGKDTNGAYKRGLPGYPDGRYPDDQGVLRVPGRNRAPRGTNDPYYYPDRALYSDRAFKNGFRDGRDQGEEDGRDNDRYDPSRHNRYRSADHGYDRDYGSRDSYKATYREGFRAGYDEGYRDANYRRY